MNRGITKENLLLIFPPALAHDKSILALAEADAEVLEARLAEIDRVRVISNIDGLDEAVLDILARDFKVDWWDANYSLEEKRRTLKDSWRVHKKMGTKAAVETAIRAIYPFTTVEEWFEYGGEPYHFKLIIDLTGSKWTEDRPRRVLERVNFYKSLRSHLDDLEYIREAKQPTIFRAGGAMATITRMPVAELADTFRFEDTVYTGGRMAKNNRFQVPALADAIRFEGVLRSGGRAGGVFRHSVPQIPDSVRLHRAVCLGGQFTIVNSLYVPWPDIEIWWPHILKRRENIGGKAGSVSSLALPAAPEIITYPYELHTTENTGGRTGMVSTVTLPVAPDIIVYPYELRTVPYAGGLIESITQLPVTIADDRIDMEMIEAALRVGGLLETETEIVIPAGSSKATTHNDRIGGQAAKNVTVPLPEIKT